MDRRSTLGESRAFKRLLAAWPVLAALVSGAAGTYGWLEGRLNSTITETTDPRIEAAVGAHESAVEEWKRPHEKAFGALTKRVQACEENLYEVYWFYVGDKAAEAEPNRRMRSMAATAARDRFDSYVQQGHSLEDAFRKTLETRPPGR